MSGKLGNLFRKAGGRGAFRGRRFSSYCEEWLAIRRTRVRESTFVKYETALDRHILPALGALYPAEMTTLAVEDFKAALFAKGLSVRTVKNILIELRAILKYAAVQYPGAFPPVEVACPREPKKEARVLSPEELGAFTAFLQAERDSCKFGILLALMTGLRIGEICALRWENVSLAEGTLTVCATMQRLRDVEGAGKSRTKIFISSPKSDSSARVIPLPKGLTELCKQNAPAASAVAITGTPDTSTVLGAACVGVADTAAAVVPGAAVSADANTATGAAGSAFVLTGTERYMEPRALQRRLAKYAAECGLEGVHFHTLRHTFATRCIELGFEIKSLSEILGHSSTTTTLDRYVHSSLELKRANMDKLSALGAAFDTSAAIPVPQAALEASAATSAPEATQIV